MATFRKNYPASHWMKSGSLLFYLKVFHTLANLPVDCGSINKSLTRRSTAGTSSKKSMTSSTSSSSSASISTSTSSLVIGTSTSVVGAEATSKSLVRLRLTSLLLPFANSRLFLFWFFSQFFDKDTKQQLKKAKPSLGPFNWIAFNAVEEVA